MTEVDVFASRKSFDIIFRFKDSGKVCIISFAYLFKELVRGKTIKEILDEDKGSVECGFEEEGVAEIVISEEGDLMEITIDFNKGLIEWDYSQEDEMYVNSWDEEIGYVTTLQL